MGNKVYYVTAKDTITKRDTLGCNSPNKTTNPPMSSTYVALKFSRVGYDLPEWKSKVKRGVSASTPLGVEIDTVYFHRGLLTFIGTTSYNKGILCLNEDDFTDRPGNWTPSTFVFNSLEADAISKAALGFRLKVRNELQTFSGMTFVGELRDTLRMLKSPASALREAVNRFTTQNITTYKTLYRNVRDAKNKSQRRRREYTARRAFAESLSGTWLELSFGAIPLSNDIAAIADAAIDVMKRNSVRRISYTAQSSNSTHAVGSSAVSGIPFVINYDDYQINESSVRFLGGIKISYDGGTSSLDRVIQHAGFGWHDVIPTAWELVPWSFLIDYFSNIGDVLSAFTVDMSALSWSQRTIKNSSTRYVITKRPADNTSCLDIVDYKPSILKTQKLLYSRTAAEIPIPGFRFELPGSNTQFLNIGALAAQQLLKLNFKG